MSDSAAIVEFYQQSATYNYIGFATFTATIYDWLLCFDREAQLIWSQPKTGASALYFFSRYLYIFVQLLDFNYLRPMSYAACTFVLHLNWVSEYIMLLGPALFSCLRVYALTGRNKALSGLTLAFGCMPFILNMVTIYAGHVVNEPMPVGCTDEYTLSATATIALSFVSRGSLILSDVIVMAVTCWSTYKVSKLARSISQPLTFNQVMLENGIVYFLSLTCLNILQVLLNAISLVNAAIDTGSYTEEFIDLVTSVLISRFLLNLRATARRSHSFSAPSFITSEAPSSSLPQFVSEFAGQVHSSSSTAQYSFGGDEGETTAESGGEHVDLERL